jgi:hypothetical protein
MSQGVSTRRLLARPDGEIVGETPERKASNGNTAAPPHLIMGECDPI